MMAKKTEMQSLRFSEREGTNKPCPKKNILFMILMALLSCNATLEIFHEYNIFATCCFKDEIIPAGWNIGNDCAAYGKTISDSFNQPTVKSIPRFLIKMWRETKDDHLHRSLTKAIQKKWKFSWFGDRGHRLSSSYFLFLCLCHLLPFPLLVSFILRSITTSRHQRPLTFTTSPHRPWVTGSNPPPTLQSRTASRRWLWTTQSKFRRRFQ